jgi:hypothetical protein
MQQFRRDGCAGAFTLVGAVPGSQKNPGADGKAIRSRFHHEHRATRHAFTSIRHKSEVKWEFAHKVRVMKQQRISERLPGICGSSSRAECLAFFSLMGAGVALIAFAAVNSAQFAGGSDQVVQALTSPYVIVQEAQPALDNTNLASRVSVSDKNPS